MKKINFLKKLYLYRNIFVFLNHRSKENIQTFLLKFHFGKFWFETANKVLKKKKKSIWLYSHCQIDVCSIWTSISHLHKMKRKDLQLKTAATIWIECLILNNKLAKMKDWDKLVIPKRNYCNFKTWYILFITFPPPLLGTEKEFCVLYLLFLSPVSMSSSLSLSLTRTQTPIKHIHCFWFKM